MANLDDYIWLGVTVDGQFIKRNDDIRIVQYQVGKVKLTFTGSSEWDGMDIIARFRHSSIVYDVALTSSQAEDGMTEGECVIPHEITDIIGSFEMALRGENDDGLVITSDPTTFTVVETIFSGDSLGEPEPATPSILKQILDSEASRVSAESARASAESARVSAENTRQSQFEEAIEDAEAATLAANTAVSQINNYMPIVKLTDQDIVHVTENDFGANMQEVRVKGKTRQNLWSNPSGTSNGVTATSNEDGSMTLSGTATKDAFIAVRGYILKPETTYTLSIDNEVPNGGYAYVSFYEADGTQINPSISTNNGDSATMSAPSGMAYCNFGIYVPNGAAASGTFHVMLNEGPTAEPWCPPGLTSVSELETVTAGKNLVEKVVYGFPSSVENKFTIDNNSISVIFRAVAGKEYVFSSSATPDRTAYGYVDTVDVQDGTVYRGRTNAMQVGNEIHLTPDESGIVYLYVSSVKNDVISSTAQVELGSTATAYEPPAVTTTPIDLDGLELCSLPDGTCDELVWNETGAVSVEQVSIELVYDGDEDWKDYQQSGQRPGLFGVTIKGVTTYPQVPFCDSYAVYSSGGGSVSTYPDMTAGIDQNYNVWIRDSRFTTLEDFKANLASNPVTFVALAASSSSIDLPSATMPALPNGEFNVWPSTNVPTTMDLTYSWDVNAMAKTATPEQCKDMVSNLFVY